MNSSKDDFGGSFSVDGENIEVDLAEFGWDREPTAPAKPQFEDEGRIRASHILLKTMEPSVMKIVDVINGVAR